MSAYRLFLLMSGVNALALDMAFTLNLVYQVTVVGLGPLQLVLVGTVLELVLFVAQIPTGVIADLYSRRISVVLGYLLTAAGLGVWGLLPTYVAVLVANAIWAVGWTCVDVRSRPGLQTRSARRRSARRSCGPASSPREDAPYEGGVRAGGRSRRPSGAGRNGRARARRHPLGRRCPWRIPVHA